VQGSVQIGLIDLAEEDFGDFSGFVSLVFA